MELTHLVMQMGEGRRNPMEKGDPLFYMFLQPLPTTSALSCGWNVGVGICHGNYCKFQSDVLNLTVRAKIKFTLSKHLKYSAQVSWEAQRVQSFD